MFKKIRIFLLLVILCFIGINAWLTKHRSTDWKNSLSVTIYPANSDGGDTVQWYLNKLNVEDFSEIEDFLDARAARFGVRADPPIYFRLASPLDDLPPALPSSRRAVSAIIWSLRFRLWAWWTKRTHDEAGSDIHLFVNFHDPEKVPALQHSIGLQKGMIGIVNAYGDSRYNRTNNVVILHELLHTLGAKDKYDLATGRPLYPQGFVEPDQKPLYPQRYAEIMGGHIPISEFETKMPQGLDAVRINYQTAAEIGWLKGKVR